MKNYYNTEEAAKILNIKIRTLRQWMKEGKIKYFKLQGGRRNFITKEELERVSGGRADV